MSAGVALSQFFETFFDEADELLAEMERLLLGLDIANPDNDQLNGIFRAAHSIKGGAGTFGCFGYLAETTHLLENLLDELRCGEISLRKDMIDLFLETKDVLTEQVAAAHTLAVCQGLSLREKVNAVPLELKPELQAFRRQIAELSPFIDEDRPLEMELRALMRLIRDGRVELYPETRPAHV